MVKQKENPKGFCVEEYVGKENLVDFNSFIDFVYKCKSQHWFPPEERTHRNGCVDIEDLDFFMNDSMSLDSDNPKVIMAQELMDRRLLKIMKEHFVQKNKDLTKRNVRKYLSGYNKMCRQPVVPMYYFITDEDLSNFVEECFDNGFCEPLLPLWVKSYGGSCTSPYGYVSFTHDLIDKFVRQILSDDITTITRKLLPINL